MHQSTRQLSPSPILFPGVGFDNSWAEHAVALHGEHATSRQTSGAGKRKASDYHDARLPFE